MRNKIEKFIEETSPEPILIIAKELAKKHVDVKPIRYLLK